MHSELNETYAINWWMCTMCGVQSAVNALEREALSLFSCQFITSFKKFLEHFLQSVYKLIHLFPFHSQCSCCCEIGIGISIGMGTPVVEGSGSNGLLVPSLHHPGEEGGGGGCTCT